MALIPFPDIPPYPGVPNIPRAVGQAIPPVITLAIGTLEGVLSNALQQQTQWGIFDSNGNQLGILGPGPTLSTYSFEFLKEAIISDFPVEQGSFASYNKVIRPSNPVVELALTGSESDRTTFLNLINAASESTDLYSVITPEFAYINYNIERYRLKRTAAEGANLIVVEISLKEIRQVSAAFTQSSPINQPVDPTAAAQVDNGVVQAQTPDTSVLQSIMTKLGVN